MKSYMRNKYASLAMLFVMYILAVAMGIVVFLTTKNIVSNPIMQMLLADVVATLVIWGFGLLFKNASTYDPYWSIIPPVMF